MKPTVKQCMTPHESGGTAYILLSLLAVSLLAGGALGYFLNGFNPFSFGPKIDGIISSGEYDKTNWKVGEYFDVNTTNNNTAGFNYFYVGQDTSNVYVAIDLCSDVQNTTSGEMVSVWLNTLNRSFGLGAPFGSYNNSWYDYRNNGTENFVYDVQNGWIKPYTTNTDSYYDAWINNASSTLAANLTMGTQFPNTPNTGDWSHTNTVNHYWYGAVSADGGSGTMFYDKVTLNFTVDLATYFQYRTEFLSQIMNTISNASINIYTWVEDGGMGKIDNTDMTYSSVNVIGNGTNNNAPLVMNKAISDNDYTKINVEKSAFASGKLQFSVELYNESAWYATEELRLFIDSLHISFNINGTDDTYGTSTIRNATNYDFAYAFGGSPNSAIPHRMYELKVAKSELENYTDDGTLGVFIQGTGEMNFNQQQTWQFTVGTQKEYFIIFIISDERNPTWSVNYYYLAMNKKGE